MEQFCGDPDRVKVRGAHGVVQQGGYEREGQLLSHNFRHVVKVVVVVVVVKIVTATFKLVRR